jgi:hypothetical protein
LAFTTGYIHLLQLRAPAWIVPEMPPVIAKDRVRKISANAIVDPAHESFTLILTFKIVAEIVMAVNRPNKQGANQEGFGYYVHGPKEPIRPSPQFAGQNHRSKEEAAIFQREIPVAFDKDVSRWGPDIVSRAPDPPWPRIDPKTWTP